MVRYSIFIGVFLLVIVPSYTQARAYYDEEEWDKIATYQDYNHLQTFSDSNKKCKKDVLLVLDVSRSVGSRPFRDQIKPFLQTLISNKNFEFGPDGVQLAVIAFSSEQNTRQIYWFKKDGTQTHSEIVKEVNSYTFKGLNPGGQDRTYTGNALKIAYEKNFNKPSPNNARPNAPDVVILFTDGRPNAARTDDMEIQKNYTEEYAKKMKANGVRIVTVAVEKEKLSRAARKESKKFREFIKGLASSEEDFFEAKFDNLNSIVDKLVDKSCAIKKGYCSCSSSGSTTIYVPSDKATTKVQWLVPSFICGKNDKVVKDQIKQKPRNYRNPRQFGVGEHVIKYSRRYGAGNKFKATCKVIIKVEVCKCLPVDLPKPMLIRGESKVHVTWDVPKPSCLREGLKKNYPSTESANLPRGSHYKEYEYTIGQSKFKCPVTFEVDVCKCPIVEPITPLLQVGQSKVPVSWDVPQPSCVPSAERKKYGKTESANLPYGKEVKEYEFTIGESTLKCPITIDVGAVPCAGNDYNPTKEECCCNKVHTKSDDHICCGTGYIDKSTNKCCPNNNITPKRSTCLGD